MIEKELTALTSWIANVGLEGAGETVLIEGFCGGAIAAGLPLARAIVFIDTLHPIHEGRVFRWERDKLAATVSEYGRSTEGEAAERWRRSPHYRLLETGESLMRRRVTFETEREFPLFPALWEAAITEFVATVNRFSADGAIGEMDCFYAGWMTDQEGGFSDADVATLERLTPFLGLAIKSASLARIANTLVETYLGRDAGRRVLQGRIARGVADRIKTVLWFSDLRNYTRISDSAPPEEIIPLLNDYAEVVVSAVHGLGGDVLKLVGDGTLAIFPADNRQEACRGALAAAVRVRNDVIRLNGKRSAAGLPTSQVYLALHVGDVFYGNIGSKDRLDFTIIGPAVNEVSRILAMSRSVEQDVLLSADFADATGSEMRRRLLSVGRYALRGVAHPLELFTPEPDFDLP